MTLQPLFNYKLLLKSLFNKRRVGNNVLLKSGRIAFSYILSVIKKKNPQINKIILPNLICEEIITVSKTHKMNISYYSVDDNLNFNINEIEEISRDGNNIILFVNYFGFKFDWEKIKLTNNSNNIFIEDNAHVLKDLNQKNKSTFADYTFSSLRKLLPLLSGAEISSRNNDLNLIQSSRIPDFGELIYSIRSLKKKRSGISKLGHSLDNEDKNIIHIDYLSKYILDKYHFSYNQITSQRRKNFNFWKDYLSSSNLISMRSIDKDQNICPYVYPCYAKDDREYHKWLDWGKSNNITIIAWPKYHQDTLKCVPDNFLKKILLFPVNHQFDLSNIIG